MQNDPNLAHIANLIKQLSRGNRAALCRLDFKDPACAPAALFRLLAAIDIPIQLLDLDSLGRWATVSKLLALTTRNSSLPCGQAMANADLNEARFSKLLASRGLQFRSLVLRVAKHLTAGSYSCEWLELCSLILQEERNEELAEKIRLRLAKDFYKKIKEK